MAMAVAKASLGGWGSLQSVADFHFNVEINDLRPMKDIATCCGSRVMASDALYYYPLRGPWRGALQGEGHRARRYAQSPW